MPTTLPLLTPQEATALRDRLDAMTWLDGQRTTAGAVRPGKSNRQVAPSSDGYGEATGVVFAALNRSAALRRIARPLRVSPLLFSRYDVGDGYGPHTDTPLTSGGQPMRRDLSFTLFLDEPDTYDGGELVVSLPGREVAVKLPPGEAVIYPAGRLHRVEVVRRGRRTACVGWIQSLVREADRRELLAELEDLAETLQETPGQIDLARRGTRVLHELLRQWSSL